MSSEREVIIHAGLPKTATTTFQNVLYANRDYLLEQEGVLYPSLSANLSTPLGTLFRDSPQNMPIHLVGGSTAEEINAQRERYMESLTEEVSSREWARLLLSAEGVSKMSVSEAQRFRNWCKTYASKWLVLLCVRHPVGWTRSIMQQRLKTGDTLKQIYEEPPPLDLRSRISNLIRVFGRENIHIIDFDSASASADGIVGTLAASAGLSTASQNLLVQRAVHANESLSLEAVQILDSMNRHHPLFVDGVRSASRAGPQFELPYLRRIRGRKFDLPDSVKDEIRSQNRGNITWLNEEFGLSLYPDVTEHVSETPGQRGSFAPPSGNETIDSIAEILTETMHEKAFLNAMNRGRSALSRGDVELAESMFRSALRLDPDSGHAKRLLARATSQLSDSASRDVMETPSRRPVTKDSVTGSKLERVKVRIRSLLRK